MRPTMHVEYGQGDNSQVTSVAMPLTGFRYALDNGRTREPCSSEVAYVTKSPPY